MPLATWTSLSSKQGLHDCTNIRVNLEYSMHPTVVGLELGLGLRLGLGLGLQLGLGLGLGSE